MAGNSREPGRSVLSRALKVLDTFDQQHREQSLTAIAQRCGESLPTVHRIVKELEGWGALTRRPSGEYRIGRRLWSLGMLAAVQVELREIALPFMQDIFVATRQTVHLAVREQDQALYVERIRGAQSVPIKSTTGSRMPLHATGVGKVLLAYAPHLLPGLNLTQHTPFTITNPTRLLEEVTRVREQGHAVTHDELTLGAFSAAVPVMNEAGACVAALGVVLPREQAPLEPLVSALKVAAAGISRQLRAGQAGR
ncbi:IclR family transcriptional regulator [Micrococcales bacterium 31B]|nr:IclR family transcriptional regulator [Micrococcales bacterium 31B]